MLKFSRSFVFFISLLLVSNAHSHGSHGLDLDEAQGLFKSLIEATTTEVGSSPNTNPVNLFYKVDDQKIYLDESDTSRFVAASIEIFKKSLHDSCPGCHHEHELVESKAFKERVLKFFKEKMSRRALSVQAVHLGAVGIRLFKKYGIGYLAYTAVTEAIESVFVGAGHFACTFFQHLYFPVAYVTHQMWPILWSRGTALSFSDRFSISAKSAFVIVKYRRVMRNLYVETFDSDSILNSKNYSKKIAGSKEHIEEDLNFKDFWAEIYSRFHTTNHLASTKDIEPFGARDIGKITDPVYREDSAAKRMILAIKHNDALELMHKVAVQTTDEQYKNAMLDTKTYLRVSALLGTLGAYIQEYSNLVIMAAMSPKDELVQFRTQITLDANVKILHSIFERFYKISLSINGAKDFVQINNDFKTLGRVIQSVRKEQRKDTRKGIRNKTEAREDCRRLISKIY